MRKIADGRSKELATEHLANQLAGLGVNRKHQRKQRNNNKAKALIKKYEQGRHPQHMRKILEPNHVVSRPTGIGCPDDGIKAARQRHVALKGSGDVQTSQTPTGIVVVNPKPARQP